MNPEQDDFQRLRQLLAVKRHEQPPPGYFDDFSRQVIIRIRAGERIDHFSIWEAFSWEAPWLQRLWTTLESKPILAGGFGVAICGLLMAGMLYSEPKENALPVAGGLATVPVSDDQTELRVSSAPVNPLFERASVSPFSGVQGVAPVQPTDSLFQQIKDAQRPRVDFINASAPR
jgi:hypothetical protein